MVTIIDCRYIKICISICIIWKVLVKKLKKTGKIYKKAIIYLGVLPIYITRGEFTYKNNVTV